MTTDQRFHKWLRIRRKLLDLTQAELAQQVGCSVTTIRKLEAGDRRPSRSLAKALAANLAIPHLETEAFVDFARTDNNSERFVMPVWQSDSLSWRSRLIPTRTAEFIDLDHSLPEIQADAETYKLELSTVTTKPLVFEHCHNKRWLIRIETMGQSKGDLVGDLSMNLTQLVHIEDPTDMGRAYEYPSSICATFSIDAGNQYLKGYFAGMFTMLVDSTGNGVAILQGSGQVLDISTQLHMLYGARLFYNGEVKMVNAVGTGSIGTITFILG